MLRTIFTLSILFLISCQPPAEKNRYTAPKDIDPIQNYLIKEIEFDDDYNSDGHIFIKQDQPLPASILAIYPTLVTNDG